MKLDNHGLTLVELLVSIALVGVIITFLFNMLVDVRHETDNNDFAYENQLNRTEFIYEVQKDLKNYTLIGVSDNSVNQNININFHFKSLDNTELVSKITTFQKEDKNYLKYEGIKEDYTWEVKGSTIDPCGLFTFYSDNLAKNYYLKINFNIYNVPFNEKNNIDRNNAVDDLEITYVGNLSNLITKDNYLTNNNTTNKQIGYCTK